MQKNQRESLQHANGGKHNLIFLEHPLTADTVPLAKGVEAVCLFVSDEGSEKVLEALAALGVKYIALRSAGFNHASIKKATALKMRGARVGAYSPNVIAEHAIALMLALNRNLIRANRRVQELNFSLDALTGFDMNGKTVGITGTGNIGAVVAKILHGFGCKILAVDEE